MQDQLGRPVAAALQSLKAEAEAPEVLETAAPRRNGQERREGTLRIIACRQGKWIAARFLDGAPREKEEA